MGQAIPNMCHAAPSTTRASYRPAGPHTLTHHDGSHWTIHPATSPPRAAYQHLFRSPRPPHSNSHHNNNRNHVEPVIRLWHKHIFKNKVWSYDILLFSLHMTFVSCYLSKICFPWGYWHTQWCSPVCTCLWLWRQWAGWLFTLDGPRARINYDSEPQHVVQATAGQDNTQPFRAPPQAGTRGTWT